jgi:hypothetical protein
LERTERAVSEVVAEGFVENLAGHADTITSVWGRCKYV